MLTVLLVVVLASDAPLQQSGSVTRTMSAETGPVRDPSVSEKKGTAVIRGRVTAADTGRPLRRVRITITGPELAEPRTVSTNLQGIYEVRDLPAGRYTVSASRTGYLTIRHGQRRPGEAAQPLQVADTQVVERIDLTLPRMGVIAGRITDELGDPLANVMVMPMRVRYFRGQRRLVPAGGGLLQTDDSGQYRIIGLEPGDYYIMGRTRETWTEADQKSTLGFVPTHFPGTTNPAEAQRVRLALGQEASGIDFAMVPGRVVTIRGTATRSDGTPLVGERVQVNQEFAGPGSSSSFGFDGGKVAADGTFVVKDMLPGSYKLSVKAPAEAGRPLEYAATTITVSGTDVDGVMLMTGGVGSVSGRIITDADAAPPFTGTRLRVSAAAIDHDSSYLAFSDDNGRVRDDWTFELKDIMGAQRFSLFTLPSGWAVKTIEHDGQDITETGMTVPPGQRVELLIVISNRMATLAGTVRDEKSQPAPATLILFPDDPGKWRESSRLIRTARPDQSGAFEMKLVPPGDYLVAAVDFAQDGDWNDPEYLKSLQDRSTRVTLRDAEHSSVALVLRTP